MDIKRAIRAKVESSGNLTIPKPTFVRFEYSNFSSIFFPLSGLRAVVRVEEKQSGGEPATNRQKAKPLN
jgi:hypothetical protein